MHACMPLFLPQSLHTGFGRMWRNALLLAPLGARVMHRVLHALLSVPVLPSPIIYYRGAFKDILPEFIRKAQRAQQRQSDQFRCGVV